MPLATREGLLGSLGQVHRVQLENDNYVYVKAPSLVEIEQVEKKSGSDFDQLARMVASCVCDENGDPLFKQGDPPRIKKGMNPKDFFKIVEELNSHTGDVLSDEAMAEAEKNSETTVSYDSPTT